MDHREASAVDPSEQLRTTKTKDGSPRSDTGRCARTLSSDAVRQVETRRRTTGEETKQRRLYRNTDCVRARICAGTWLTAPTLLPEAKQTKEDVEREVGVCEVIRGFGFGFIGTSFPPATSRQVGLFEALYLQQGWPAAGSSLADRNHPHLGGCSPKHPPYLGTYHLTKQARRNDKRNISNASFRDPQASPRLAGQGMALELRTSPCWDAD